jgi:hypothetical protein
MKTSKMHQIRTNAIPRAKAAFDEAATMASDAFHNGDEAEGHAMSKVVVYFKRVEWYCIERNEPTGDAQCYQCNRMYFSGTGHPTVAMCSMCNSGTGIQGIENLELESYDWSK